MTDNVVTTEAGNGLLAAIQSGIVTLFAHDDGPDDPSPIPAAIAAIEVEAVAAERERIAADVGRRLTDARVEILMRQEGIPLHGRGISVDLQARGVAASIRATVLRIVTQGGSNDD